MNLPTDARATSIASGPTLPTECRLESANIYFKTTAPIGLHQCLVEGEWTEVAGGGSSPPALTEHQIGFGSASNLLTGDAGFTFEPVSTDQGLALTLAVSSSSYYGFLGTLNLTPDDDGAFLGGLDFTVNVLDSAFGSPSSEGIFIGLHNQATDDSPGGGGDHKALDSEVSNAASAKADRIFGGYFLASNSGILNTYSAGVVIETSQFGTNPAAYGLLITDVAGASANYAIKTGAGDIVFGALAGIGVRPVLVDANGKLSAP